MKRLALVAALSLLVVLFAMPGVTHAAGSQQITRTFEASTNVAVAGEGDGNGFEITPANAYVDDSTFAVDTNSGAKDNGTTDVLTGTDKHNYGGFGMDTIPSTSGTINGITVRADIAVNSLTNAPFTAIRLSYNGGTSWTAVSQQTLDPITETTYTYGGAADTWGRTWTGTDLEDGQFLVQVINGDSNATVSNLDYSLDYIQVTVTFTPAWDSYSDTGRTTQPPGDTFSGGTNVVYMKGTSFYDSGQTYDVGYYDGGGNWVISDNSIAVFNPVGTRGDLGDTIGPSYAPTYGFTDNPTAAAGTWHIVVQPTGASSFPPLYSTLSSAPNSYDLIADDTCTVDGSAIPEFSTVMAAIGVAGMCFGVYWWMRKKYRRKMARAYVPN